MNGQLSDYWIKVFHKIDKVYKFSNIIRENTNRPHTHGMHVLLGPKRLRNAQQMWFKCGT
jgi:hypothetical protein